MCTRRYKSDYSCYMYATHITTNEYLNPTKKLTIFLCIYNYVTAWSFIDCHSNNGAVICIVGMKGADGDLSGLRCQLKMCSCFELSNINVIHMNYPMLVFL